LKDGGGYEIVITDNQTAPEIPAADTMQPIA
jgi:branched-chain amino acid transport system substrate-binding protein